jgi:hypothetical protein
MEPPKCERLYRISLTVTVSLIAIIVENLSFSFISSSILIDFDHVQFQREQIIAFEKSLGKIQTNKDKKKNMVI